MSVVLLILGLVLFVSLVVVHEFGHFLAARRNGVDVEEFGIGFPPKAWSKKTKAGFIFSINWLPIGGFVRLKGESDAATAKGSLGAASTWAKSKIMLAGVVMNLVVAFGLLTILAWVGMPQLIKNQFTVQSDTKIIKNEVLVSSIENGSPAAKAGLQTRDRLLSIGPAGSEEKLDRASKLPVLTKKFQGKEVVVRYEHKVKDSNKVESKQAAVQLRAQKDIDAGKAKGYFGAGSNEIVMARSTWSAPVVAAGLISQFTAETFRGLGTALAAVFQGEGSRAAEQVSGPVGIIFVLKGSSSLGLQYVLMIIAIISLTLAIMNVLPIPALDGGRLFMVLLSRMFGRRLSPEMEERIVGASFIFLLFLIILITFIDVKRFF